MNAFEKKKTSFTAIRTTNLPNHTQNAEYRIPPHEVGWYNLVQKKISSARVWTSRDTVSTHTLSFYRELLFLLFEGLCTIIAILVNKRNYNYQLS